ncbi:MAG: right-handed parallel beta-helix repeat-containing protein, partial [Planctomycetota bacterium]
SSPTIINCIISGNSTIDYGGGIACFDSSPTINNCTISGNSSHHSGGGIVCFDSSPVITNCIITGNTADYGGGICCERNSNPQIKNCKITGNTAYRGGGISCRESSPLITNCTITDNSAGHDGGGIHCGGGSPTITGCVINSNKARELGGAVYSWGSPTITNCNISGNSAEYSGGGICFREGSPTITNCTISSNKGDRGGGIYCVGGNPTITNCNIAGNEAKSDWRSHAYGGGIYCRDSSPTITNCNIIGNEAGTDRGSYDYGGGIYCDGGSPTITNCTISGNTGDDGGGGIYCGGSNPIITNCILWDNLPQQITGSALVTYSNIEAGWEGQGNIDVDPYFAFPNDYHIMPDSPCIDAGDPNYIPEPNETDLDGQPRIIGGRVDMGAYEYYPNSPSIAVSAVSFSYVLGWPKTEQTLLIKNCGTGTLQWEIVEDCPWLQAAPANGTSTTGQADEVTLMVDPNGLAPGYYTCMLEVLDPNAANSPVNVHVALHMGVILRVPQQFLTIQEAIDAADDYDLVLVADGTYTGAGNRDLYFKLKAIAVCSENGPQNCIIDCNGTEAQHHRAFNFYSQEQNLLVQGFTITNGYAGRGGAISCEFSSPTIKNCTINGNVANGGGGIYCDWYSNPKIANSTITGNSAEMDYDRGPGVGGGIYSYGSLTITNSTITGNSAEGEYAYGGGIFFVGDWYGNDTFTFSNCTITGNSAATWGGGIYCWLSSNLTITNCIFWSNEAPNGPQIYLDYRINASVSYTDVQGDQDDVYVGSECTLNWGLGNIDADPCFVDPGFWADANDPNIVVEPNDPNAVWIEGDYYLLP